MRDTQAMIKGIINYSHHLLEESVCSGDTVIDATCGNGHDTLFLSKLVGEDGKVLAFDVQEQAVENTRKLLNEHSCKNAELILDNHAHLSHHLSPDQTGQIGGAIFNLGYLPGGDKSIITSAASTIIALDTILLYLKQNGIIVLVIYHGHPGGQEEKEAILKHVIQLDQKSFNVLQYRFINQKNNPPFIVAIERK